MDAVDDRLDVQEEDQPKDHEHELGDQVGEGQHQVEGARLLDADDVDHDEDRDQHDRRGDMRGLVGLERCQHRHVLAEKAHVADSEVRGDRYRRGVVQKLDPADDVADRRVEGAARKARAAARVRQGGRALRVVEGGGDEDESGEDQRDRREPEGKSGGDPERVVDARSDVAVAGREERAGAQRAGELGRAADDDTQVAGPAPAPVDGVRAHRSRG